MKKIIYTIIFTFILMLFPVTVDAATVQFQKCFGDRGFYSIIYDDSINTAVSKDSVTFQDISNGHMPYPNGTEDVRYNFTVFKVSNICLDNGQSTLSCPVASDLQYEAIASKYKNGTELTSNIEMVLNENTLTYDILIKDVTNNKVNIRKVPVGEENIYSYLGSNYAHQYLNKDSNGYYHIYGVGFDQTIELEFYQKKDDDCKDSYIGLLVFSTPNSNEAKFNNPAKTNPNAYGCNLVKEYLPQGMTNTDDISKLEGMKKNMIKECYSDTVTYAERINLASSISEKFNALKNLYSNYKVGSTSKNTSTCNNTYSTSRVTYSQSGTYWAIVCTETYTAKGDIPKLVKAGSGFEYQAYYSVTRTCNITQISRPTKKPQCTCSTEQHCPWKDVNGNWVDNGGPGGPNTDFDNCVSKCDGGKYTQSCINKCNNEVYSNKRGNNDTYSFNAYSRKISETVPEGVTTTITTNDLVPDTTCSKCTPYGKDAYVYNVNACGQNHQMLVSTDYCAIKGYYCWITVTVGPAGCSWNPEAEYRAALSASAAELSSMSSYQTSTIPLGDYTYNITDTYLKGTDGKDYIWSVNSKSNPQVKITGGNQVYTGASRNTVPLGNSGGGSTTYTSSATKKVDITVSLPLSYVNRITGKVAYSTTGSASDSFQVAYTESGYAKSKLQQVSGFKAVDYYHTNGERRYYTDVHSKNTNVVFENNKPKLVQQTPYNISVTSSNVGGGNFSSNISCYYGVYNDYYNYDCEEYCDPKKEVCDCGIQHIFRPIVLEDVFPNARDPRFNWSSGAIQEANKSMYKTKVDPVALTESIQSKGQRIYESSSGETDYIFILTADNIKAIKNYNSDVKDINGDGERNYLDYDMTCYKNAEGREVCTSNFLDNNTYVKYGSGYNSEQRKQIAGCNNAKDNGTRCDTSIK